MVYNYYQGVGKPQHLNFHYFSLFMTKIHTTMVYNYYQGVDNVTVIMSTKILNQGFLQSLLVLSLNKFFEGYQHLIEKNRIGDVNNLYAEAFGIYTVV
jgi:hypothetical protein